MQNKSPPKKERAALGKQPYVVQKGLCVAAMQNGYVFAANLIPKSVFFAINFSGFVGLDCNAGEADVCKNVNLAKGQ